MAIAMQCCTRISVLKFSGIPTTLRGISIPSLCLEPFRQPFRRLRSGSTRSWSSVPTDSRLKKTWINQASITELALSTTPRSSKRHLRTTAVCTTQASDPSFHPSLHNSETSTDTHPDHAVTIRIVDFSSKNTARHEVEHASLETYLKNHPKPDWATCRWVYVNGVDQGVLRSLGSAYKLHQLALEDVLESRGPTKADWYEGHLFIAMPLHKLLSPTALEEGLEDHKSQQNAHHRAFEHHRDWRTIAHRKFNVAVEQASMFLANTDTVITIFQKSGEEVFEQIISRLESENSVLRSANDPSMLVQTVIDVAVDLCMPIEKVFADEFSQIELTVLSNPAIQQSRSLYILRSRLTLLLDNFIAINSLLKKLCGEHLLSSQSMPFKQDRVTINDDSTMFSARAGGTHHTAQSIKLSHTTQIYLRDVLDHVHTLSASTEVAIRSTENLTSLIFNTIAASQNESVRQLTVVSSFFLPLTFLTGYMGMNFESMPVVQQHSDLVFWAIAAPSMVVMALFMRARALRRQMYSHAWAARARKSAK